MTSRVEVEHTAMLRAGQLELVHQLLVEVFGREFSSDDWDHTLGGVHALVWEDERLIAHGSVVQRRLTHAGRVLRCGYVEGVAVRENRQRQGFGTTVMDRLEAVILGAYEVGALSASAAGFPFYLARGWQPWGGETCAVTPEGLVRTADDDDSVMVWGATVPLDPASPLACDWRDGDVW
ncbi:MAG: GNAT family N-acetyltransferase [Dehalococcoidia bacterium]